MNNKEKQNRWLVRGRSLAPRSLIFALALFNFLFIWFHLKSQNGLGITFCYFCRWYDPWSFTNEPSILLLAAFLLLLSKRWNYLFASALSGYVAVYISFYLIRSIINFGLVELLQGLIKSEPNVFLIWEMQLVWAAIILIGSIYYFLRERREPHNN